MSTRSQQPAIPASEVLHPFWCAVSEDCSGDLSWLDSVNHFGAVTVWDNEGSDTRLSLRLSRYDDHEGSQVPSPTQVELVLEDICRVNDDGSKMAVTACFDGGDVDQLIRFLQQYRRKMRWANELRADGRRNSDGSREVFEVRA